MIITILNYQDTIFSRLLNKHGKYSSIYCPFDLHESLWLCFTSTPACWTQFWVNKCHFTLTLTSCLRHFPNGEVKSFLAPLTNLIIRFTMKALSQRETTDLLVYEWRNIQLCSPFFLWQRRVRFCPRFSGSVQTCADKMPLCYTYQKTSLEKGYSDRYSVAVYTSRFIGDKGHNIALWGHNRGHEIGVRNHEDEFRVLSLLKQKVSVLEVPNSGIF